MLAKIYPIYEQAVAEIPFACRDGCASCCTRSVTMTTAEGRDIAAYLADGGGKRPDWADSGGAGRPLRTTNDLAANYLAGREVEPEPEAPWIYEPCGFLRDERCTIYPVRPFACRSFGSTRPCAEHGIAEAPEWLITLNIVVNQLIEHCDHGGFWGNMYDVLEYLDRPGGEHPASEGGRPAGRLLPTRPVPGFLVPPGEEAIVDRFLEELARSGGLACTMMARRVRA